jgi:hypothetical protein
MRRIEIESLEAVITVGMNKYYSAEKLTMNDVIKALTTIQKKLITEHDIKLSAKLTPCNIVFAGQIEESVTISFINYPKFPLEKSRFELGIEIIVESLMQRLSQNRVVVTMNGRTTMYEKSAEIDPRIYIAP